MLSRGVRKVEEDAVEGGEGVVGAGGRGDEELQEELKGVWVIVVERHLFALGFEVVVGEAGFEEARLAGQEVLADAEGGAAAGELDGDDFFLWADGAECDDWCWCSLEDPVWRAFGRGDWVVLHVRTRGLLGVESVVVSHSEDEKRSSR